MRIVPKPIRWMGLGALAAWLFDRDRGKARRVQLADRSSAVLRRAGRRIEGRSRYAANKLQGLGHAIGSRSAPADDRVLADRVRSEALGPLGELGDRATVDVRDGVVVVRGEMEPDEQQELVRAIRRVPGVDELEVLTHAPGEAAPNKEPARSASSRARDGSS